MSRTAKTKELINTRLANRYGGWIYCSTCGETIGYLCYVTYNNFSFTFKCKCGSCGSLHISFTDTCSSVISENEPVIIKNRLCCPSDKAPLFTVLEKKLESYKYDVVCSNCGTRYIKEKTF